MAIALFIMGLLLLANGIYLIAALSVHTGVILTAIFGILLIAAGVLFKKIQRYAKNGALRIVKCVVLIIFAAEIFLSCFIAIYGAFDKVNYNEDVVIVLGSGVRGNQVSPTLKLRLDKAVEYYNKNPEAVIIVSGGQGYQEKVTEAKIMQEYLVGCKIPKEKILKEEKATSTLENLQYSKEIADDILGEGYKVVVITNGFHMYRAMSIAKKAGVTGCGRLHGELVWYNTIPCYIRESIAVVKMWLIGA